MQTITALAVDSREGLTLLESIAEINNIPLKIIPMKNLTDASTYLNLTREVPDIMTVATGVLLKEGCERLLKLSQDDRLSGVRIYVLTEFQEERQLFDAVALKATFITMPNSFEGTAEALFQIYESAKKRERQVV